MTKAPKKPGRECTDINIIKVICNKPTAKSSDCEKPESILCKIRKRKEYSFFVLKVPVCLYSKPGQ